MDIFWQITIVESLLNLAIFAVAVIAFALVRQLAAQFRPRSMYTSDAAVGVLFGAATAAALLLPVHMSGGASTGSQTILLALAGLIAGPLAAAMALLISVAAQLLPGLQGGQIDGLGLAMSLASTGAGIGFRMMLGRNNRAVRVAYYHFPILGAVCAVLSLGVLWWYGGRPAVLTSALAAFMAGMLAAAVLGTLLLHEIRRHEAEQEVRESEAQLATQAKELAVARDSAERANHAKSAFLANMSHELRTPLNAILGFSEIIAQECLGPVGSSRYKEYAGDIHSSGAHLLSLINDLLDVAKIEAGKMEILPHPLDARRTLEGALKLMGGKAREKRQELAITVEPDAPPLYADERALKQILINLVSNAVKFTPEGGKIVVSASAAKGGGFQIACEDNGPGIPREKLDKIFTPFNQVDNRYDRQAGGTGLGLALVRGLAELHGGRAWLESEYGKGCRAYVVLPAEPPKAVDAAAA
jgi:signal transduction histidine kinase